MFRAGEMTRSGYVAGVCAGGVMVLIALAMDLAGVVLPGRQYTVGLLGGLVVVMTGQLVSGRSHPPQASGPTPSAESSNPGTPTG
jgi:hypothetical protein